jgi:hypothetical protein
MEKIAMKILGLSFIGDELVDGPTPTSQYSPVCPVLQTQPVALQEPLQNSVGLSTQTYKY